MDYINSILQGLIEPLGSDDQEFVKEYWATILKTMLSPYQRKLEADLSYNILSTQTYTKSFYEPFVPVTESVTYNVSTLPVTLPVNLYDIQCTGATYRAYATLALPCKIDNATNVVCDDPDVIVDGNILLGEGTVEVMYDTNVIADYTYSTLTGELNSAYPITQVTANKGSATTEYVTDTCEVFLSRVLFCPHINFKHAKVGQRVRIAGTWDTISEVVDNHRIRTTSTHGSPGFHGLLEIDLFPYAYATDMDDIPSFMDGKTKDIDYKLFDGKICFPAPVTETLITTRSYIENNDMYDRFMKHLEVIPEDKNLYRPYWRSVFTNDMEIFFYAAIGYPYTLPEMGDVRVSDISFLASNRKHAIEFTDIEDKCRITTPYDYFDGGENGILLDDGQFLKILHHVTASEVEVERELISGTQSGYAARFTVSSISLEDDYGYTMHFRVPAGQFPLVKVDDILEPWTMLITGLKVFDRTENDRYQSYESYTKFVVDDAVAVPSDWATLLQNNTFVITSSEILNIPENIYKFLMPAWSQYHLRDQMSDKISIHDVSMIGSVASVVFRKFLPTEVIPFTPAFTPAAFSHNYALIQYDMPMEFLGTYDGITPEITDLKWNDGFATPLDISLWPNIRHVIEGFGINPATTDTPLNDISILPGANKLLIEPTTTLWPSVGVDVSFSFVVYGQLVAVDFTTSRGGVCDNTYNVARAHNGNIMYFLEDNTQCLEYIPGIYSLSDLALSDETGGAFQYDPTNGTRVVADTLLDTDFERLGVRPYMTYVHQDDVLQVLSFDDYGQPVLSGAPVHGTLTSDFGFYCFVAEDTVHGTIRKN